MSSRFRSWKNTLQPWAGQWGCRRRPCLSLLLPRWSWLGLGEAHGALRGAGSGLGAGSSRSWLRPDPPIPWQGLCATWTEPGFSILGLVWCWLSAPQGAERAPQMHGRCCATTTQSQPGGGCFNFLFTSGFLICGLKYSQALESCW